MSQIGELESLELLWLVVLLRITLLGRSKEWNTHLSQLLTFSAQIVTRSYK